MLKAVFFGSIGTIAETAELERRACNTALSEAGLGLHLTRAEHHAIGFEAGRHLAACRLAILGHRIDQGSVGRIATRMRDTVIKRAAEGLALRPGVLRLFGELHLNGIAPCLVTDASRLEIDTALPAIRGFDPLHFEHVECEPGRDKPEAEVYFTALARLGLRPDEVISFEETADGIEAATAAAIPVIALPQTAASGPTVRLARALFDHAGSATMPATRLDGGRGPEDGLVTLRWLVETLASPA
ncbi:MAG: HAD family hydrolase [Rubricella sp.]